MQISATGLAWYKEEQWEDFKIYCKKENLEPNGNARTNYVNLKVYQNYKSRSLEPLW